MTKLLFFFLQKLDYGLRINISKHAHAQECMKSVVTLWLGLGIGMFRSSAEFIKWTEIGSETLLFLAS